MKTNLLMIFAVIALLTSGCKKDSPTTPTPSAPVANFTYTGAGTFATATVQFTSTSTNANSYSWDFGDNGTSTDQNPSHAFTAGGTYTVRLTATGTGGTNSITKTVNILNPPTTARITYVKSTAWSAYDSGGTPWDASSAPDVYFQIQDVSSNVLANYSGSIFTDATPPIQINISTPYQLQSLTTNYYIELFDYDTIGSDQDMGFVGFNMSNYPNYPSSITLSNPTYGITVVLGIQWQ